MDIHAPDKPVHSFKDFAVHIAIVTVGILIALGLMALAKPSANIASSVKPAKASTRK